TRSSVPSVPVTRLLISTVVPTSGSEPFSVDIAGTAMRAAQAAKKIASAATRADEETSARIIFAIFFGGPSTGQNANIGSSGRTDELGMSRPCLLEGSRLERAMDVLADRCAGSLLRSRPALDRSSAPGAIAAGRIRHNAAAPAQEG